MSLVSRQGCIPDQKALCKGEELPSLAEFVEYHRTPGGFEDHKSPRVPVLSARYLDHKRYLLKEIRAFTRDLQSKYRVERVQSPEVLSIHEPLVPYYLKKFPTRYYSVQGGQQGSRGWLRPATCANALRVLARAGSGAVNTVIHQTGCCFRAQKSGECRSLLRLQRFVMPDYHLLIPKDEAKKAFLHVYQELWAFYRRVGLQTNISEIYQYTTTDAVNQYLPPEDLPSKDPWILYGDATEEARPYFKLKYTANYIRGKTPLQLGTIQIDDDLPASYGIDGVLLHFTMGSLERLVAATCFERVAPARGLEVIFIDSAAGKNPLYPDVLMRLKTLPYPLRARMVRGGHALAKAIKGGEQENSSYPLVLLVGAREASNQYITVLNRSDHTSKTVRLTDLPQLLHSWRITPV